MIQNEVLYIAIQHCPNVVVPERAKLKSDLEAEYKGMLEKNKLDMENMEKEFQKRLQESQGSVRRNEGLGHSDGG